jgi:hypothetical protein
MDTVGGQSGAPVWIFDGVNSFVVSVHTLGATLGGASINAGTRLNAEKFERLTTWVNGDALPNDRPDLIDDGQEFSTFAPMSVTPGVTPFSISNRVRNIGTAASGPFCVSYYASADPTITTADFLIGSSCGNASLAPFAAGSVAWSGTPPSNIPAGTYWVGWIIDSANLISEFDNSNNSARKTAYQLTIQSSAGGSIALGAAVLPGSRAVWMPTPATAYALIAATGTGTAMGCSIAPTNAPAGTVFSYQQTNAANQPIGTPNTPVNIPAGEFRTFVIALTPIQAFPATEIHFSFDCTNTSPAPDTPGVNTFLLTSSAGATPDVIAIAVAVGGIVTIPGVGGTGALAVATANVGASAPIVVSADTGNVALPLELTVCQTNSAAQCLAPPTASVTTQITVRWARLLQAWVTPGKSVSGSPPAAAASRSASRPTHTSGTALGDVQRERHIAGDADRLADVNVGAGAGRV